MEEHPEQIQVDPAVALQHQQAITGQLVARLTHDLSVTRAALDAAQAEAERLRRVTESLRQDDHDE